jgi:PilZ domain
MRAMGVQPMSERRTWPRARIALSCTLRRRAGTPVAARTVDLGGGGMSVAASRPLVIDEVLAFELRLTDEPVVNGNVRVLREHGYGIYAMRFEKLPDSDRGRLNDLAAGWG